MACPPKGADHIGDWKLFASGGLPSGRSVGAGNTKGGIQSVIRIVEASTLAAFSDNFDLPVCARAQGVS